MMLRLFLVFITFLPSSVTSFSAEVSRSRLIEAFSSPSGKLTYSPEIVIPEPKDPTAMLLLNNAVQNLSGKIRKSKANAVFLRASMSAVKTFAGEQESARGSLPGPVPVIYCLQDGDAIKEIAEAGSDGVLIKVCNGEEIKDVNSLMMDGLWIEQCKMTWDCGIQPIPEVTLCEKFAKELSEDDLTSLVDKISQHLNQDPVCVVLTVNPSEKDQVEPVALPSVPKALGKRVPVLGSVRVVAGDNRLGIESNRCKDSGFQGAFLRSECLPGFRTNLDLNIVGSFWAACINDLKSVKSKSFAFRAKNNMEKDRAAEWAKYQMNVLDSGALGDPSESYSVVDSASGEYKGFA